MKKALVASILGMALGIASSYGQGYVIMQNYDLVGGVTPVYSGITYAGGPNDGKYVGAADGAQVDLLYSLTGAAGTYSLVAGSQTSFFTGSKTGGTPVTDGAGSFFGSTLVIPGYTSGNAFFIVQAWVGASSFATATITGQSAVFSMPLQTNSLLTPTDLLNLGGPSATTVQGLQPFAFPVPEPSTPALSCLAAALMFLRRRK
jgi:hypothetical protein